MSFLRYAVDVSLSQPLQVVSDPDNVLGGQIGNGLWTSAQELALFLRTRPGLMRGQSVLELGAGLGLVGQAAFLTCAPIAWPVLLQNVCSAQDSQLTASLRTGHGYKWC